MRKNYKLTIGIPTFNGENTIKDTVESIVSQFDESILDSVDVLISNNKSTDSTEEIINELGLVTINNSSFFLVFLNWKRKAFSKNFAGKIARFTDGEREILIRHLNRPTRSLHPSADCLRGAGYQIENHIMMTDEQLVKLYQAGMEIGGHTVTHPILRGSSEKTVIHELKGNKKFLENLLNTTIQYFAYPNGKPETDYSQEQVFLVKNQGYMAAVSTQKGVVRKDTDLYQLPRFTPWDKQPHKFVLRMIMTYLA